MLFRSPSLLDDLLMKIPNQMIDNTLLVAWRVWYARNEITHDKLLPSIVGSQRFLCSYINTLRDIRSLPTDQILKGKKPLLNTGASLPYISVKEKSPINPWKKPPPGWVKLMIDGSFCKEDGSAGTGVVLRDESGNVIFSARLEHQTVFMFGSGPDIFLRELDRKSVV